MGSSKRISQEGRKRPAYVISSERAERCDAVFLEPNKQNPPKQPALHLCGDCEGQQRQSEP